MLYIFVINYCSSLKSLCKLTLRGSFILTLSSRYSRYEVGCNGSYTALVNCKSLWNSLLRQDLVGVGCDEVMLAGVAESLGEGFGCLHDLTSDSRVVCNSGVLKNYN